MKHNRSRVLRWTQTRTPWVKAVRAWRQLLPDWTPTLDEQVSLETMPREHRAAVAVISEGWEANDPKWDVLMALLEWERRQERTRLDLADEIARIGQVLEETGGPVDIRHLVTGCTWPACSCSAGPPPPCGRTAIIPLTVVKSDGSTSETTVETPLKASFLDNLRLVKPLSEKNNG